MTLIKSMLLGSATAIVAVAAAQAADLPTRKAAPVEYVKICNVGGITGWVLPGSDTCVKLSGYITGQFEGGNLTTQYNWADSFTTHTSETPGIGQFVNIAGSVGALANESFAPGSFDPRPAIAGLTGFFPLVPINSSPGAPSSP